MRDYFEQLAAYLDTLARPGEVLMSRFAGETSDFIRFNRSAVRQASRVQQSAWTVSLIRGLKRIDAKTTVPGRIAADRDLLGALVSELRAGIEDVPDDPFLLSETRALASAA